MKRAERFAYLGKMLTLAMQCEDVKEALTFGFEAKECHLSMRQQFFPSH